MKTSTFVSRLFLITLAVAAAVVAGVLSCGGDKGTNPPLAKKPDITSFQAADTDIMPGDSTLVSYVISDADSAVLVPGSRLTDAAAGSLYLKPAIPTRYTLRAFNKSGQDSASLMISMSGAVPAITTFTVDEDTIVVGDSVLISWATVRTDSLILQGVGTLTPVASGTRRLTPATGSTYRAIAYNLYGRDTAVVQIRVEVPTTVQAINGLYYKGAMGTSTQTPQIRFQVTDNAAFPLYKVWMHFRIVEGDGTLSADSAQAEASGSSPIAYGFTGDMTHATVRAFVPGVDTVNVSVRASTIRAGADGQGQYVLFGDDFGAVKALNGQPISVEADPSYWINYANYEASLGVVVMIEDANTNNEASDDEPVVGVIMNTIYTGTSAGGWGIGSLISQVVTENGPADLVEFDPTPPAAYRYQWNALGLTVYTTTETEEASRTIIEIHVYDVSSGASRISAPRQAVLDPLGD